MRISQDYKRRIRITGMPHDVRGYVLTVHDDITGEPIDNVVSVIAIMSVTGENRARVTYNRPKGEIAQGTVDLTDIAIDITANEQDEDA